MRLAMRFTVETPAHSPGEPRFVIRVMAVEDDPARELPNGAPAPTARNLNSEHPCADLVIEAWAITSTDGERRVFDPSVEYRTVYKIDRRRAEAMVATLRKLENGLQKAYEQDGSPAHLGQFMLRVARILGVKEAIEMRNPAQRSNWLSEIEWSTLSLPRLSDQIARTIDCYIRTGKTTA